MPRPHIEFVHAQQLPWSAAPFVDAPWRELPCKLLSRDPASGACSLLLRLPLAEGQVWLALLAFLGGLSAATAMVIVSSLALATMLTNELIVPALGRSRLVASERLGRRVLWIRRAAIVGLAALAYAYYRNAATPASLAAIGLLAFAAAAQFAYMVLFSYSFFFDGLTGLTITIGAIITLGILMVTTARVNWNEKFARKSVPPAVPSHA